MARSRALWADVARDLKTATIKFQLAESRAASLLTDTLPADARFDRETTVAKLLHDCYGALESAIERLVKEVDGAAPSSGFNYHVELIRRAADDVEGIRPAMVSAETARDLQDLRAFHHVVRHAYSDFEYQRAAPNVAVAARVIPRLSHEIAAFAEAMGIKSAPENGNGRTR
jgi:hypothetical protein